MVSKIEDGNVIESSEDLFYKVAENIAQTDKFYDKDTGITMLIREFYLTMSSCDFYLTHLL
jgi:ribonucleoside-diphosphate reductase alpha chain